MISSQLTEVIESSRHVTCSCRQSRYLPTTGYLRQGSSMIKRVTKQCSRIVLRGDILKLRHIINSPWLWSCKLFDCFGLVGSFCFKDGLEVHDIWIGFEWTDNQIMNIKEQFVGPQKFQSAMGADVRWARHSSILKFNGFDSAFLNVSVHSIAAWTSNIFQSCNRLPTLATFAKPLPNPCVAMRCCFFRPEHRQWSPGQEAEASSWMGSLHASFGRYSVVCWRSWGLRLSLSNYELCQCSSRLLLLFHNEFASCENCIVLS